MRKVSLIITSCMIIMVMLSVQIFASTAGNWSKSGTDWNGYIKIESVNHGIGTNFKLSTPDMSYYNYVPTNYKISLKGNYTNNQGNFTGNVYTSSISHSPSLID